MSKVLKAMPILIGDDVGDIKNGITYSNKRFHLESHNRFYWPHVDIDNDGVKSAIKKINRPVWIEIGLGTKSLLPHVRKGKVKKLMVYDKRAWAKNMMSFSHSIETYRIYKALRSQYGNDQELSIEDMMVMRTMSGRISNDKQAAIALFLLDRCGGETNKYSDFQSSLALGGFADKDNNTKLSYSTNFPLQMFHVVPHAMEAMRICAKVLRPMSKSVHVHINDSLPSSRMIDILISLNNIGFSWSAVIDDTLMSHEVKRIAHVETWGDSIVAFSNQ